VKASHNAFLSPKMRLCRLFVEGRGARWLEHNALASVSSHVQAQAYRSCLRADYCNAHANRSCLLTDDACTTHLRCISQPRLFHPAFAKCNRKISEIELHVESWIRNRLHVVEDFNFTCRANSNNSRNMTKYVLNTSPSYGPQNACS
jgi:hypothetical protein